MSKPLTIGSKIFVVHNSYANQKKSGGRVVQARVTAFVNKKGKVEPEFRIIGSNGNTPDASPACYHWFTDINEAIKSIES
jgi:hypothetical protein